jgi:hypothetical protein
LVWFGLVSDTNPIHAVMMSKKKKKSEESAGHLFAGQIPEVRALDLECCSVAQTGQVCSHDQLHAVLRVVCGVCVQSGQ